MTDPEAFIESVGGLHDARLVKLAWFPEQRKLEFAVNDLHSTFNGLPDDPGRCPATLVFSNVTRLDADVRLVVRGLMVYEVSAARREADLLCVTIAFSPSGTLTIECRDLECVAEGRPGGTQP